MSSNCLFLLKQQKFSLPVLVRLATRNSTILLSAISFTKLIVLAFCGVVTSSYNTLVCLAPVDSVENTIETYWNKNGDFVKVSEPTNNRDSIPSSYPIPCRDPSPPSKRKLPRSFKKKAAELAEKVAKRKFRYRIKVLR